MTTHYQEQMLAQMHLKPVPSLIGKCVYETEEKSINYSAFPKELTVNTFHDC